MKKTFITLFALLINVLVFAQWSNDPSENNRITAVNQVVYGSDFVVNDDGITYVYYSGPAGEVGGSVMTFLQIIDKDGNKLFPDEGKVISRERARLGTNVNQWIMLDKQGNALITVSDCRNSPSDSKKLSYSIYKVSPTGEFLWGESGLDLEQGHSNVQETKMTMIQLADNSYVFAWTESEGITFRIQMERVSVNGEILWDESLILEEGAATNAIPWPYLTDAGDNQFILVYSKGPEQMIMARKFDFDGTPIWAEDTRICTLGTGGTASSPLWTYLQVISDRNGGVFVGWYNKQGMSEKTYVSHVKNDGQLGFPGGELGLLVGNTPINKCFGPELLYDQVENCLFVIWRETDPYTQTAQRLMMQKVSITGELKWGEEGLPILPLQDKLSIGYYQISDAGENKFTAFYMTMNAAKRIVQGHAVKVDGKNGDFIWDDNEVIFSSSQNEKGDLKCSPMIHGTHWLIMWDDNRKITGNEQAGEGRVFMQRLNADASFGNPTSVGTIEKEQETFHAFCSGNGKTEFILNHVKAGMAEINIHSLSGQKIAVVQHGYLSEGTHQINWDSKTIIPGMYLATYSTPEGIYKSVRIIVK